MTLISSLQNGSTLQQIGAVFGVKSNPYVWGKNFDYKISDLNSSTWKVLVVSFDRLQKTKELLQETGGKGFMAFVITSTIRATIELIPLVAVSLMIIDWVVDYFCKRLDTTFSTTITSSDIAVTSSVEVEL